MNFVIPLMQPWWWGTFQWVQMTVTGEACELCVLDRENSQFHSEFS